MIRDYQWPGNVRELQSVIRRSILMTTGPVIVPENLSIDSTDHVISINSKLSDFEQASYGVEEFVERRIELESTDIYSESLEMMEIALLQKILRHTNGNQSKAAELLGITRGSLRTKIRTLGISIEQVVATDDKAQFRII